MKFFSSSSFSSPKGWPAYEQRRFDRPRGTCPINHPFPALKRRTIFKKSLRDTALLAIISILLIAAKATAGATNGLSDAEIQGRRLAQQLLAGRPVEYTNTGVLKIRDAKGKRTELPVKCQTIVTSTNWQSRYEAKFGSNVTDVTTLVVTHSDAEPNRYVLSENKKKARISRGFIHVGMGSSGNRTMIPFAGSDFWVADLGLEFFHWPEQKVLKKEFRRNCSCVVLESTNPSPATNGYSRVDSWIDEDSGGIVMARAYDAQGRLLKEFFPKDIKKVNGEWQVQSMEIDNVQTGSRTRLELDLQAP